MEIEELNGYDPNFGYPCSNEKVRIFLQILAKRKLRPKRVLSICSGGEVPLVCFLPIAEEVIAIDHSRRSLGIARTKIAVIKTLGVDGWYDLLRGSYQEFTKTWSNIGLDTTLGKSGYQFEFLDIVRQWKGIPKIYLRLAMERLDRLKFIHGDLTDATSRGPFDTMYLSNALEHTSRTMTRPNHEQILNMLAPNGSIFYTENGTDLGGRIQGSVLHCKAQAPAANWSYWIYQKGGDA